MPSITHCRSCNSSCLIPVLDLGEQPWCNDFLISKDSTKNVYPLKLVFCPECYLAQLSFTVPKEVMFTDHTYVSGTTKTLRDHFYKLAEQNQKIFNLKLDDLIIDIGGNDGTQLLQYKKLGFTNLHNVESASNIAKISTEAGILTYNNFFNDLWAIEFLKNHSQARLISASGVFFHLEELHEAVTAVKRLLAPNGVFVVQFMYLRDIVDNLAFDAIYHEHLCYYTLESLNNLLKPHGLHIYQAERSSIHGGSIIARICHSNLLESNFGELALHDHVGLNDLLEFAEKIEKRRNLLSQVLTKLKAANKKVYGYGAPAKGNTLLNYFNITNNQIQKLVEINKLKIGRFTPGSLIPVEEESSEDLPDYYLVLAWNFLDEILEKNNETRKKGVKFITPFPEIKVY